MDLNSVRAALRSEPFRPFDLCLADGRRVAVKRPEFVAMNNRAVFVIDEESFSTTIEPLLIVSLEPHRGSSKSRNGSQGKKRKS
ncbi:MAG TPA: hypothetical protein VMV10_08155 [Pirellulales bacterium]|nr:hypothetical protein [Pirellulales bacterium]